MVQGSLVGAGVQHQHDVLLGNRCFLGFRVDADQAQNSVGGDGEKPDHRLQQYGEKRNDAADPLRQLFFVPHGNALGHKLAEHKGKEGKDQRDENDRYGVDGVRLPGGQLKFTRNCRGKPAGKVVGGESRTEKACQRDADLNGGKKPCRLFDHFQHFNCLFVAVLCLRFDLLFIQRDHRNFGCGKKGVQQNQNQL